MKIRKWLGLLFVIVFLTSMIPLATTVSAATVGVYCRWSTPSSTSAGGVSATSVSFSHTTGLGAIGLMLVGMSCNCGSPIGLYLQSLFTPAEISIASNSVANAAGYFLARQIRGMLRSTVRYLTHLWARQVQSRLLSPGHGMPTASSQAQQTLPGLIRRLLSDPQWS